MVPNTAARVKNIGLLLTANTQPASAMSSAPKISSFFRPNLSAMEVMTTVIRAPPASAAVKIHPMAVLLSPIVSR